MRLTLPPPAEIETLIHHARTLFGPENQTVSTSAGGDVTLDPALFQLWQLGQDHPQAEAITRWCEQLEAPTHLAEVAWECLMLAGLLPAPAQVSFSTPLPPPAPLTETPLVSVVIVNKNGQHHLETCLTSLATQSYPQLEIIVVDNASTDGSVAWLKRQWPQVNIIALPQDWGFAFANNRGMEAAQGAYFFLLNNDTRLEPDAIAHLIARVQGETQVGAVVPMLRLMNQPAFVNAVGNSISPHSWGSDNYIGHLDVGQFASVRQVPSACFAAVLIPRASLAEIGPMAEFYHYYYEDLDWSWRARSQGFNILAEPRAIVYHAFGGTTATRPQAYKLHLVARNRLLFALANLSRTQRRRFLRNYLSEDALAWQQHPADIQRAYRRAWLETLGLWPIMRRRNNYQQRSRLVTDEKILREMAQIPAPRLHADSPYLSLTHIGQDYGPYLLENKKMMTLSPEKTNPRPHLLIVSPDRVQKKMAGPGIRYWELAHVLASEIRVTLAVPHETDLDSLTVTLTTYTPQDHQGMQSLAEQADVVFGAIDLLHRFPSLATNQKPLIIDLYAPFLLENLETHRHKSLPQRTQIHNGDLGILQKQIQYGDFFICATERQRDLWLGVLLSLNRINPLTYSRDESLRHLIDVVPFGIPAEPPQATQPVLKGVWPGIDADDKVILWGGGIWNWLDPLTPIRAMPQILAVEPRAKLVFMGSGHPNPIVPEMQMAVRAENLARELDLLGKSVFFNREWVPYAERVNYLLEADVAVSAHFNHVETRFAFRTRLLDCLWASLPMVVTAGDALAELITAQHLGHAVPAEDAPAMAEALLDLLQNRPDSATLATRFEPVQAQFRWQAVAQPLLNFCRQPHLALDRAADVHLRRPEQMVVPPPTPLSQLPTKALQMLLKRGPLELLAEISRYLLWRLTP